MAARPQPKDENQLIIPDSQLEIDRQAPVVQTVTRDKLGGVNWQDLHLQSNQISRKILFTVWLEKLILPSSLLDYLSKSVFALVLGSVVSVGVQFSLATTIATLPVFLTMWGLYLSVENSHLVTPYLYLCSMFILGFIVTLFH